MSKTFLITGGMGCIGAWVIYHLIRDNQNIVNFDQSNDRHRLDWLMTREEQEKIQFIQGDLRNKAEIIEAAKKHNVSHIIHLAALQVPACKANPILGSQVNVTGTINVFEAARELSIPHIVYASSIAVYGTADDYSQRLVSHDADRKPRTLYGGYKVANEENAKVYYYDHGITSTALRPYTVYGIGRDQGLTSEPSKAIVAASKGEDYHLSFGGKMQFHFASDVARQFIEASNNPLNGAFVFNMGQPAISVSDFAEQLQDISGVTITLDDKPLPFPEGFDPTALHENFDSIYETPLREGIAQTLNHAKQLGDAISN
jgi:nucleoside-diphosphate-sugar epimerase